VAQHEATLHDGSVIEVAVRGDGRAIMLPVRPDPVTGPQAGALRQWGTDPELGSRLVDGLAEHHRVIAADYEGHRMAHPAPGTLSPDTVAQDLLAIADAAGARRFAYYGYSWLALCGFQLAIRSSRVRALAMGGFPPIEGPYAEMLAVTEAAWQMSLAAPAGDAAAEAEPGDWSAIRVSTSGDQTRQFATFYQALQGFDDSAAQAALTIPRLVLVGAEDEVDYGPGWGDVHVSIAGPVVRHQDQLWADGWLVHVLPGATHMTAMQADAVLPVLVDWLKAQAAPSD
jgi:pimeloyl-ACP methyl ester carboxylesterase